MFVLSLRRLLLVPPTALWAPNLMTKWLDCLQIFQLKTGAASPCSLRLTIFTQKPLYTKRYRTTKRKPNHTFQTEPRLHEQANCMSRTANDEPCETSPEAASALNIDLI